MLTPPAEREQSDPTRWLGDTPLLNVRDDKLRLRVTTVTQFSRTEPERLRSICDYVASIPFNVPAFAGMQVTRATLAQRRAVGWYSKAALFQAMLRAAGFPARVRMIRVGHEMYRGLAPDRRVFALPVVEVWTRGRWVATDNYVYDPRYLAAAREAVARQGWRSGYGVHLDGQSRWNGSEDALVMIALNPAQGSFAQQFPGVYDDPEEFAQQVRKTSLLRWLVLLVRNRLMSLRMNHRVRRLRAEAGS